MTDSKSVIIIDFMSNNKSKKTPVPIYVFDEHNMAFYFWHKAKDEGYIDGPLDLFHIDAHADMGMVEKLEKSIYYSADSSNNYLKHYKDIAETELGIANFIIPAILNGLIRNVYFIYPEWRKFKPRRKKLNVSSAFGEGNVLKHNLKLKDNKDKRVDLAFPDLQYYSYNIRIANQIPANRRVILDIDFDYFACIDTIQNHIHFDIEITPEQFNKKNEILKDERLRFIELNFTFEKKNGTHYVTIAKKKSKEVSYLPTKREIEAEIDRLVSMLVTKKAKPAIITLCRSCISGFCPKDYSMYIETKLTERLQDVLSTVNIFPGLNSR